jgi:HD domain-containing protein
VPPVGDLAAFLAGQPVAVRAAEWAARAHDGQERVVDGAPFLLHPLEVALILHVAGYRGDALAAALLHDVVEKGGVTHEQLRAEFGDRIAGMVGALTEDGGIGGYDERKADLRARAAEADDEAVLAADKIAKARELRLAAAADRLPADEVASRRAHYRDSLDLLERRLPGHPLTDALRFELELQTRVPALSWLADRARAAAR